MKTQSSWFGKVVRGAMYAVCAILLVASVSAFRESVLLGIALAAVPAIYFTSTLFTAIAKSSWALAFLLFAVGVLEIYLGVAKGMPIAWVLGGVGVVVMVLWRFVSAAANAHKVAFPKGDLPFPKVSPMTHSFDSAFGATTKKSFTSSSKSSSRDGGMDDDSLNGRGGINQFHTEDDPFGLHL